MRLNYGRTEFEEGETVNIDVKRSIAGKFGVQFKGIVEGKFKEREVYLPTHSQFNKKLLEEVENQKYEITLIEKGVRPTGENTYDGKEYQYDIKPILSRREILARIAKYEELLAELPPEPITLNDYYGNPDL